MKHAEWTVTVPPGIADDPIWKLEVHRLALFFGDLGWRDGSVPSKNNRMWSAADPLHRPPGSINVNLTGEYSRSKGLDRAWFTEIPLGFARESRNGYDKSWHILPDEGIKHRMELTTRILAGLTSMFLHQRKNAVREQQAEYLDSSQSSTFFLDSEAPLP